MASPVAPIEDSPGDQPPKLRVVRGGGGPPAGGPPARSKPRLTNGQIAVAMLIATESMLFSGLVGAFLVLRGDGSTWPPPDQPRLPLLVTMINTGVLLASALTMYLAVRATARGAKERQVNALGVTAFLGLLFVMIQGVEWTRLIAHGLTLSSSTYGATFYVLIGTHGLHVIGAVIWLVWILNLARTDQITPEKRSWVEVCAMYWYFVTALWPMLFALVYLS